MEEVMLNHWAILVAALSNFLVGGLWYSPLLFHKAWLDANGLTEEEMGNGHPAKVFGLAFVFSLLMAYTLAYYFLGSSSATMMDGIRYGLVAGIGFAALPFAIITLFENKRTKYAIINCGYIIVSFALMGLIIGAWR